MLRTAVRAKPGTRRDPRPQLLSTRGTDWNASRSNVAYLSRIGVRHDNDRLVLGRVRKLQVGAQ